MVVDARTLIRIVLQQLRERGYKGNNRRVVRHALKDGALTSAHKHLVETCLVGSARPLFDKSFWSEDPDSEGGV